jgi:hypothetical protein
MACTEGGRVSVGVATEMVAGEPVCTPQMGGCTPTGEGAGGREGGREEGWGENEREKIMCLTKNENVFIVRFPAPYLLPSLPPSLQLPPPVGVRPPV